MREQMRVRLLVILVLSSCASSKRVVTATFDDVVIVNEVDFLTPQPLASRKFSALCHATALKCAAVDRPWLQSEIKGDVLLIAPNEKGVARVVPARRWDRSGQSPYRQCHANAMRGLEVTDLELTTATLAQCPQPPSRMPSVFDDVETFGRVLRGCVKGDQLREMTVRFKLVNETTSLQTRNFAFDDAEGFDAETRACVSDGLTMKVDLLPGTRLVGAR
jgi:hypothetical protein